MRSTCVRACQRLVTDLEADDEVGYTPVSPPTKSPLILMVDHGKNGYYHQWLPRTGWSVTTAKCLVKVHYCIYLFIFVIMVFYPVLPFDEIIFNVPMCSWIIFRTLSGVLLVPATDDRYPSTGLLRESARGAPQCLLGCKHHVAGHSRRRRGTPRRLICRCELDHSETKEQK